MRYLMSTSIIPAGFQGAVEVRHSYLTAVKRLLTGEFTSAVGHAATAELLTELCGLPIKHNRISVSVHPGDEFIVFQLLRRPPEGVVLNLETLESLGYEFRRIYFHGHPETHTQAGKALKRVIRDVSGAMDAPQGAEETAECLQVIAGAIESLDFLSRPLIDTHYTDKYPEECPMADALRDEARAILDAPQCSCGAKACEFENCDGQEPDPVCQSCCAQHWTCQILCPECGERVAPPFPVDYADRRLRSSCGPETPGHCGACGAKWD